MNAPESFHRQNLISLIGGYATPLAVGLVEESAGETIVISRGVATLPPLAWYLLRLNEPGRADRRVVWLGEDELPRHGPLWVVEANAADDPVGVLGRGWRCLQRRSSRTPLKGRPEPFFECRLGRWVQGEEERSRSVASDR